MLTMKDLFTLSDFAKEIGASYHQVYSWVRKHGLPHIKIGTRRYIRRSDYEEWLQAKITVEKRVSKAEEALMEIKDMSLPKYNDRITAKLKRVY